ncbi:MAG: 2-phospho-L-lactate guanylyltransferase [Steroidobacteraceae bacterium]
MKPVYALVPIKPFARAKRRLASALSPPQRAGLARAMARRTLRAAAVAHGIDRVYALCADRAAAELARGCGATPLHDDGRRSLSQRIAAALDALGAAGAGAALYLASDLPQVTAAELDALIAQHQGGISLVAAARDGGTNALLCDLPRRLPLAFGPGSAARHLSRARHAGLVARRVHSAALARDLDTVADLHRHAARSPRE